MLMSGVAVAALAGGAVLGGSSRAGAAGGTVGTTSSVVLRGRVKQADGVVLLKGHVELHRTGSRLCGEVWALSRERDDLSTWHGDVPKMLCVSRSTRFDRAEVVGACLQGFSMAFMLPRGEHAAWLQTAAQGTRRIPVRRVRVGGRLARLAFVVVPVGSGVSGVAWSRGGPVAESFGNVDELCLPK
jgi:hypothetical protein